MKTLFEKHLNKTKIALVSFNKESKHVLELYNAGFRTGSYAIAYLIDFSLPQRPAVYDMAKKLLPEDRIITSVTQFASAVTSKAFSFAVFFDAGFSYANEVNIVPCSRDIATIETDVSKAYAAGKGLADKYAGGEDKAYEFNFRWPTDIIATICDYVTSHGIFVMQGYNNDVVPSLTTNCDVFKYQVHDWGYVNLMAFASRYRSDPFVDLRTVNLRLVLGTDYGVGKASFIINRLIKGTPIIPILGDYCYLLNVAAFQYPIGANDLMGFKEKVLSSIARAHYNDDSQPKRDIYYKVDGRIEDMIYGVPVDRGAMWGNFHQFFDRCVFTIIAKPDPDKARLGSQVRELAQKFQLKENQIEVFSMNYDGSETAVSV